MRKLIAALFLVSTVAMVGCAGTSAMIRSEYKLSQSEKLTYKVTAPGDMEEEAKGIFNTRLTEKLTSGGLLAQAPDAEARELDIQVTNYRMRHGATRVLLGILAGPDNIQSLVRVKNKATGAVLSEIEVESKNPSAWGTSRGMIEDHADKIVETLTGVKK
jgi:Domain of unknown function (DUF4410)